MSKNKIKPLSKAELEKLNTKRLMAYRKKLLNLAEMPGWDPEIDEKSPCIICREDSRWEPLRLILKSILDERENVE